MKAERGVWLSTTGSFGAALERIRRFASSDDPVLFLGETGSGKTQLAEVLHQASPRAAGPFHRLDLATLDDGVAGSELFGHVPGAFTDARQVREGAVGVSRGGTLFLDELGKASLAVQRKLLHVIERRTYRPVGSDRDVRADVRFLFAANEDLGAMASRGTLLPDLLPRIGLSRVTLPPLRTRPEDVPPLLRHFISRHAPSRGWPVARAPEPAPELEDALRAYPWPGNVRELESLVCRLLLDATGSARIGTELLVDDLAVYDARLLNPAERRAEQHRQVESAIARHDGNRSRAARELGIGRSTLYRIARTGRRPVQGM